MWLIFCFWDSFSFWFSLMNVRIFDAELQCRGGGRENTFLLILTHATISLDWTCMLLPIRTCPLPLPNPKGWKFITQWQWFFSFSLGFPLISFILDCSFHSNWNFFQWHCISEQRNLCPCIIIKIFKKISSKICNCHIWGKFAI